MSRYIFIYNFGKFDSEKAARTPKVIFHLLIKQNKCNLMQVTYIFPKDVIVYMSGSKILSYLGKKNTNHSSIIVIEWKILKSLG